jgi:enoyl-CoA hydratase
MSVRVEKNGPVTTVILSRPEVRNAVDGPTAAALAAAFRAFDADEEAHVGVLFGDNGTFCAGADLKAFADEERRNHLAADGDGPMGISRLVLSKPVIAAIAGYAVGGGLELALWCDLRVVEEDTVLGLFNRRWGVPLIDGGTVRLPRLIGLSHALDLILTGRPVNAEEALRIGLANRIVPKGQSRAAAEALAHDIARFPPQALRADRMSAHQQFSLDLNEALHREFIGGLPALWAEGLIGATQFMAGSGRHGASNQPFESLRSIWRETAISDEDLLKSRLHLPDGV